MNSYEKYYLENMYPLQDGVMNIIKKLNTPFFLTGGTALSRHYFKHRYSDDLDLFVISNEQFQQFLDLVLISFNKAEESRKFTVDRKSILRYENHAQIFLYNPALPELKLKIDFVNDVAKHYGAFEFNPVLGKIDSWQNILSNKLTALFRFEPKDIVDIWIISKNKIFDWKTIMEESKTKEVGIEPDVIFNILESFPIEQLDYIKWVNKPDYTRLKKDLHMIAADIFYGRENTMCCLKS